MGTHSKYLIQIVNLVQTEDLPDLPQELQQDFRDICIIILAQNPYTCLGLPNHALKGRLKNYLALEIDFNGIAYRIIYRICEKPAPKRVVIISFAEHDTAYFRAKKRTGR